MTDPTNSTTQSPDSTSPDPKAPAPKAPDPEVPNPEVPGSDNPGSKSDHTGPAGAGETDGHQAASPSGPAQNTSPTSPDTHPAPGAIDPDLFKQEKARKAKAASPSRNTGGQNTPDPDLGAPETGGVLAAEAAPPPSDQTKTGPVSPDFDNLVTLLNGFANDYQSIRAEFGSIASALTKIESGQDHQGAVFKTLLERTPDARATNDTADIHGPLTGAMADFRRQVRQAGRVRLVAGWKQALLVTGLILLLLAGGTLGGAFWGPAWLDDSQGWKDAIWQRHGEQIRNCYQQARQKRTEITCRLAIK